MCIGVSSFSDDIEGDRGLRVFYSALLACAFISLCCQYAVFRVSILKGDKKRLEELLDYAAK